MYFRELMAGLAEKIGLKGEIEIDDEERCLIAFDGMDVVIQGVDAARAVAFVAPVGELPPERPDRLYRTLLEANHVFGGTAGATLSVNPEGGWVYLCRQFSLDALDVDGFADGLEGFLNTLAAWRTFVAEYRARPEEAATGTHGDASALAADFLRV